jgi:hypothetical protein
LFAFWAKESEKSKDNLSILITGTRQDSKKVPPGNRAGIETNNIDIVNEDTHGNDDEDGGNSGLSDSCKKMARKLLNFNQLQITESTGYGLDDRGVGVQVPVGVRVFSSPRRPDRLWGSPNLPSNGYRGLFPRG